MPSEWRETTLGEVINLKRGFDLPAKQRTKGGVPIVSSSGVSDYHCEAKVKAPGVVTGRYGTIGQVFFCEEDFWPLNTTLFVEDFKGNDPKFIFYFLKTVDFFAYSDKAAVPGVNRNHLHTARVQIPEKKTQTEIAQTLGALDDKITLLRETNATLEAIAQALFKSWFVDFDPVRAKAEGRDPVGVPPEVADLFPSEFEDSELGGIPKGWKALRLDQACEINPTRRLGKGAEAPYLEMAAVPTAGHRPEAPVGRPFSSGTKFINGDTLLARITPCLENGKTAFVDFLVGCAVGWGSTEYIVMRPKPPLPDYWAYLLCRHEPFRQFAIQAMVGTSGRQRVEVSRLAQYPVAVPEEQVAGAFATIVEPLRAKIAANDEEAKTLSNLRDTLLPRLMSGKLRLSESTSVSEVV